MHSSTCPPQWEGVVLWISVGILVCLFAIQRFGTGKVGYFFAPIISLWFLSIGTIGIYNSVTYDPTIVKAFLPSYILHYFIRNTKDAWISLGGIVLTVTGTEALFADVGHFSVRSIQLSLCCVVYPALMLVYTGQAAFLRNHCKHRQCIRELGGLVLLQLAFQSIGVVYGDIGTITSPLYVFPSTFSRGIKHEDDILGVLILIYYIFTVTLLIKYICIVLRANYNGEDTYT